MDSEGMYAFIRVMLARGNISGAKAAEILGFTQQNFNKKSRAGTLRALELVNLLNALGYRVYAEREGEKVEIK